MVRCQHDNDYDDDGDDDYKDKDDGDVDYEDDDDGDDDHEDDDDHLICGQPPPPQSHRPDSSWPRGWPHPFRGLAAKFFFKTVPDLFKTF